MEKNKISKIMPTCFYVNIEAKQYGVIINIKDIERAEEIIQYFKTTRKEQINAWKKSGQEVLHNGRIYGSIQRLYWRR